MGASGWFITAMAVAGASGVSLNYFAPATLIRAAAILRSLGRYAERLVAHEATLRLISRLPGFGCSGGSNPSPLRHFPPIAAAICRRA